MSVAIQHLQFALMIICDWSAICCLAVHRAEGWRMMTFDRGVWFKLISVTRSSAFRHQCDWGAFPHCHMEWASSWVEASLREENWGSAGQKQWCKHTKCRLHAGRNALLKNQFAPVAHVTWWLCELHDAAKGSKNKFKRQANHHEQKAFVLWNRALNFAATHFIFVLIANSATLSSIPCCFFTAHSQQVCPLKFCHFPG